MPKRKLIMTVNLPTDVILQILSRLPSKSIARFRCVSKLWKSLLTLGSPYFTELFLTQSITRPRLLFVMDNKGDEWYLYSSPQISCKNSVTAEFHMSLPERWSSDKFSLVSGLIYWTTLGKNKNTPMICSPSTRHLFSLPNLTRAEHSFLGYNSINKQFSVLAITSPFPSSQNLPSSYQILNLESGKLSWRSLDCPLHHYPSKSNVCINGILYYIASFGMHYPSKMVCFDLNSEEFKFIDKPWCYGPQLLVNFKGKLGGITTQWVKEGLNLELSLFVLEDVEKEEWSKHVYRLPSIFCWNTKKSHYRVVGVTGRGDVVLYTSSYYVVDPFFVYFFNLEKNILRKIEIKGLETFKDNYFKCCVDYVEDLKALNWS